MKNGDLVAEHFSYIRTGVKLRAKGLPWQVDRDDIVGCVYVRIVKDATRYDRALGTFKTWLRGRMAGAVGDALRALAPGTRTYPVSERQLRRPDLLIDEAKAGRLPCLRAGKEFRFDVAAVEHALLERAGHAAALQRDGGGDDLDIGHLEQAYPETLDEHPGRQQPYAGMRAGKGDAEQSHTAG